MMRRSVAGMALLQAVQVGFANPAMLGGIIGGMSGQFAGMMLGRDVEQRFTLDSARLRPDLAAKIAVGIGFRQEAGINRNCHAGVLFLEKGPSFCYFETVFISAIDTFFISPPPLPPDTVDASAGILVARHGFEAMSRSGYRQARFLSQFLMSAYFQELDAPYRSNDDLLIRMGAKPAGSFWLRNIFSSGWAMQYAYRDNPMRPNAFSTGVLIGGGYLFDLLAWFPMLAGPFIGEDRGDRIVIPFVGLGMFAVFKLGLFGLAGQGEIAFFNKIALSPYRIPRTALESPGKRPGS